MSFKNNFTLTPRGFLVNTAEPVDARFSVPNSESRLNIPTGTEGFTATQLYNGLLMFQKDTEELYLLLDKDNASLESSWKLIYPASGSTSDTGSLITASAAGNIIEFEKANGDTFTITVDTGSFDTSSLLITASAAGNVIEFEKGNGDTFTLTVDTGSLDTSSLLVTGSVNQNVLTFEKGNGDSFTLTVDTGSGGSGIFEQTGSFFATTNDLQITGSLTTTGSVNLALETSSTAVDNVMVYDSQSGEVYFTSSDTIGGSSVIYTGEVVGTPQTIQTIKTLDFNDNETLVQFDTNNGELKFIFGTPPTPSVGVNTSLYNTNKFNLETQSFSVTGTYNRQANGFISASLKETDPDTLTLETTDIDVGSLTRNFIDRTGSKATLGQPEYRFTMELTSSSPIDGSEEEIIASTTLTLSKTLPDRPSITHVLDAQRVVGSTIIEVGATGSFNYTGSVNNSQNWRFLEITDNSSPSITALPVGSAYNSISGSVDLEDYSISQSFSVNVEADYDSNNGQPGDFALNNPLRTSTRNSPNARTYNRVRSVRAASFFTFDTQSVLDNLDNLSLFETGFTSTGGKYFYTETSTGDPQNVTIEIERQNNCCDIIVIDDTYTLTQINTPLGDAMSAFTMEVINGWRIYRSGTLAATSAVAEYVLKR